MADVSENLRRARERTSPSQIGSFEKCPRRWFFRSILGEEEPQSDAQRNGTLIHAEVERYLEHGAVDPSSPWAEHAMTAVPLLPPRESDSTLAEQWVEVASYEGGPVIRGRYDVVDMTKRPVIIGHNPLRMVFDVKSKSDFKYALSPTELADDIQIGVYGMSVLELYPQDEAIGFRHVNILRKKGAKPRAKAVDAVLSASQLRDRHARTVEVVRQMQLTLDHAEQNNMSSDEVRADTGACDLYPPHGCPHRAKCGLDPAARSFAASLGKRTKEIVPMSSLMDRLKQKGVIAGAPAVQQSLPVPSSSPPMGPHGVTAPPPASSFVATGVALSAVCPGCLGRKYVPELPTQMATGPFFACKVCKGTGAAPAGVEPALVIGAGPAAVPPDAPGRTSTPEEIAAEEAKVAKKGRAKKEKAIKVTMTCDACGDKYEQADGHECSRPALVPATTGNPAGVVGVLGSAPAAVSSGIAPASAPVVSSATPPHVEKVVRDARAASAGRLTVYIDCTPTKGPDAGNVVPYEEWLAPICEAVAEELGKKDWRLADFNTCEGELAAAIRACIGTLPEVVSVTGFSKARAPFLDSVLPHARLVVKGV